MLKIIKGLSIISFLGYILICLYLLKYHQLRIPVYNEASTLSDKDFTNLIFQIRPILTQLVQTRNYKYFRVDLEQPCKLSDQQLCLSKKKCELKCECKKEELPFQWIQEDEKLSIENQSQPEIFDYLKPEVASAFMDNGSWSFDKVTGTSRYVDLTIDKEEFTGYQGQKIWQYFYNNHCEESFNVCQDNRFLYRLVSGMHSSVSSHLTNFYIDEEGNQFPNVNLYYEKVGYNEEFLKNLQFAVTILFRAFNMYYPQLQSDPVDSGDFFQNIQSAELLNQMSKVISQIKDVEFEDAVVFGQLKQEEKKEQFVTYFKDILSLLDCVDCKKCKVYGKMQVLGMGAALSILMQQGGEISRNEFIALINTMNKWTQSIEIMHSMKILLQNQIQSQILYTSIFFLLLLLSLKFMKNIFNKQLQ